MSKELEIPAGIIGKDLGLTSASPFSILVPID
jgi:hypothetical protein